MAQPGSALEQLQNHLRQTQLLGSISSALYYDQNTVMPAAGAEWRGDQLAMLASQLHERQSSDAYADLVAAAEAGLQTSTPAPVRRNLELLRLELNRQRCLDPLLVARIAQAQSRGNAIWQEARRRSDFSIFAPALESLISQMSAKNDFSSYLPHCRPSYPSCSIRRKLPRCRHSPTYQKRSRKSSAASC